MTPACGPLPIGIGLRHAHHGELLARRPPLDFVEVHAENFFADGGAAPALLDEVRRHYAVSLHGVGLSLGSAGGLDPRHLARLAALAARVEPALVSDHVAFARGSLRPDAPPVHAADLLPVAFTPGALAILAGNVDQAQQALGRRLLVENLSSYLAWADDALEEPAFLAELCRRTGCGLLLDLNNVVVNALNRGAADPAAWARAWLMQLPAGLVGQIHLAGHSPALPGRCVVDDHGQPVGDTVWQVYADALRHCGPVPTLIEWDTDLPALDVLLAQARQAQAIAQEVLARRPGGEAGVQPAPAGPGGDARAQPACDWPQRSAALRPPGPAALPAAAQARPATRAGADQAGGAEAVQREAARQQALLADLFGQRDPGLPTRECWTALPGACALAGQPGVGPAHADRLDPYRRNAAATAARALRAAYPTVAAMLGNEAWRAAAWALWRDHPPRSGDLADWGADLPAWLAQQAALRPWPWLADSARLDWAVHRAARAADAAPEPQTLGLLGEWPADRLRLMLLPGTAVVRSDWPIVTLHAAHRQVRPGGETPAAASAEPARQDAAGTDPPGSDAGLDAARAALVQRQAESACVVRRGWDVDVQAIDRATAAWMADLLRGLDLAQALQRAQDRSGEVGVLDFTAWLTQALQCGWIWRAGALGDA